ncbi:MAG: methylenetetrahydrofolate--tRNA-(uracil(54)-C(5))-methyltransferase (FADH(2)-oxidizing) TrmFO [Clostridia bacterium]|nr:methylenetetrahydrofolate--tRNA-(uracil(54)-C(5))-methyltransferase (FADH(2)-oxidizing) TrmFO [Clostridia bacterium]
MSSVTVIGAGLAGAEAALTLANEGVAVTLIEQKPIRRSPAHHSDLFAEVVCSNSFKSDCPTTASGLLKCEMKRLGSALLPIAYSVRVPAGGSLAVDRNLFAEAVTEKIRSNPLITVVEKEQTELPEGGYTVLCTGPLTDGALYQSLTRLTGGDLHFYDAAAPIVTAESIDSACSFSESRYGKGGSDDYLNCPMTKEEYEAFYEALISAEGVVMKEFERSEIFEGCMPIEVMAKRGKDTVRFGPLKPVGLTDPRTGRRPYAVVQLRKENEEGSLYNLVGFQTNLLFAEQKRVFSLIPALKNAEFVKYGVMHRNTYLNAPRCLNPDFSLQKMPHVFVGGQLSGVEGYMESVLTGLVAARNILRIMQGKEPFRFPLQTMTGALMHAVACSPLEHPQPMNANFGILPALDNPPRDKAKKKELYSERALQALEEYLTQEE